MSAPRYVSAEEIARHSDVALLARELRAAYMDGLASVQIPLRVSVLRETPFAAFDTMPAYSDELGLFIAKIGTVVPKQDPRVPSVNAVITAFSSRTGALLALIDGVAVTNLKCAAVAALVTDICAIPEASTLAVIGTGAQARSQIRGALAVRAIRSIRVYSRDPDRVQRLIGEEAIGRESVEFLACSSAESAVFGADIVSTATTSTDPIVAAEALGHEALHINCFGNHTPESRELPARVLLDADVIVVEDLETAISEAGELHRRATPLKELVHLDSKKLQHARTVFASTGHAFLDLVASKYLIEKLVVASA